LLHPEQPELESQDIGSCAVALAAIFSWFWFALVVTAIVRALNQRGAIVRLSEDADADESQKVAVIVPARNESVNIATCLISLLEQDYPTDCLRIVVVDDESTDDTAEIVSVLAARHAQLIFAHAPKLPPGWKGKVHACCFATKLVPPDVKWLCFIDADMRAQPALIKSAMAAASAGDIDLLSLAPRHELHTFAERLMIPCGLYLLSFSQDLNHVQARETDDAVATGQFMLLRRKAYDDVGGHAAVHDAICEDVALARLLKRRGHCVFLMDGSLLLSTRMYTGWRSLWPGIAKNLTDMLGGPLPTLLTAVAGLIIPWGAFLLPAIDYAGCGGGRLSECAALIPALFGSALAFGLHIAGAAYFRIPLWYGLLFPVGYSTGALIALDSLRRRIVGRIPWKGRIYQ
jgi:chlorobactene glucosyltransferase